MFAVDVIMIVEFGDGDGNWYRCWWDVLRVQRLEAVALFDRSCAVTCSDLRHSSQLKWRATELHRIEDRLGPKDVSETRYNHLRDKEKY